MIDKEQYYDNEIAPLLAQVAEKCRDGGLPLFCSVQYNDESVADTMHLPPDSALELFAALVCLRSGRNMDAVFFNLLKFYKARDLDKDSLFIKALGQ